MKSVLISIRPEWCELIASDRKTVEVRKTKPKLEPPFKVYIYCTAGKLLFYSNICGYDMEDYRKDYIANRKVIGEFVCDKVFLWNRDIHDEDTITLEETCELSCLSEDALLKYADGYFYGWHISDLVIYNKPKKLRDLHTIDKYAVKQCEYRERAYNNPDLTNGAFLPGSYVCMKGEIDWCSACKKKPTITPPQSWCYVEALK